MRRITLIITKFKQISSRLIKTRDYSYDIVYKVVDIAHRVHNIACKNIEKVAGIYIDYFIRPMLMFFHNTRVKFSNFLDFLEEKKVKKNIKRINFNERIF